MESQNHGSPYLPLGIAIMVVAIFVAILLRIHAPPLPPAKPLTPMPAVAARLSAIHDPVPPGCEVNFDAADGDAKALNELTRKSAECLGIEVLEWCDISAADRAGLETAGASGRACP